MLLKTILFLFVFCFSSCLFADSLKDDYEKSLQKESKFQCGNASVYIHKQYLDDLNPPYLGTTTLIAKAKSRKVELVYDDDQFSAKCLTSKSQVKYIIFQSFCGGSGCRDLDNYGIIQSSNLRVLLVPNDYNREEASRILGYKAPQLSDKPK